MPTARWRRCRRPAGNPVMDDFLIRALVGGMGIALVSGLLGVFVSWRRMAFFGDTLAHASLLGIALGYVAGIGAGIGVIVVGLVVASVLVLLQRGRRLANDTLLAIISHGALALGLVVLSLTDGYGPGLTGILFGDILSASWLDVAWITGGGGLVVIALLLLWRPLLAATVDEELARVEGVAVAWVGFAFMALLAVVVALAMKMVGILLVTALLIIPAAAVRPLASTPEGMAAMAAVAGCLSVAGGLWASFRFDTPAGPSIVVAALLLFALGAASSAFRRS